MKQNLKMSDKTKKEDGRLWKAGQGLHDLYFLSPSSPLRDSVVIENLGFQVKY